MRERASRSHFGEFLANDEGLQALLRFLEAWSPNQFTGPDWPEDMKDQNVVFALESERLENIMLHNRQAARALCARSSSGEKTAAACLVTGEHAPVARLHPSIKGVWGAQTTGASIVSFNKPAFKSYGHEQGENAPISEAAAFAYTSALNHFLARDSTQRIQIGDTSTVFWGDSPNSDAAHAAENILASFLAPNENVTPPAAVGGAGSGPRAMIAVASSSTSSILTECRRLF